MFTEVEILNFRGFAGLRLEGLKRVNLVVGRNNAGKTSLLEGIALLANPSRCDLLPAMLRPSFGNPNERYYRWLIRDQDKHGTAMLASNGERGVHFTKGKAGHQPQSSLHRVWSNQFFHAFARSGVVPWRPGKLDHHRRAPDFAKYHPGSCLCGLAGTRTRSLTHTANGGNSTTNGLDFYGRLHWGNVSPWFSYSYVDFRAMNNGTTTGMMGISHHNGRFGLTWEVTPKLFITPSLVIRSTPENVAAGNLGRELRNPYCVNLYVLYKATQNVEFYVTVNNLTDNHYALAGTVGQAIPQETLGGMVGFKLKF